MADDRRRQPAQQVLPLSAKPGSGDSGPVSSTRMIDGWRASDSVNSLQRLEDGRFHRWYRFVLAYSDKLVTDLIERYDVNEGVLLDPFCGTGTTLVASKGQGIPSVGIDSNPVAAFASTVKTDWTVDADSLVQAFSRIRRRFGRFKTIYEPRRSVDKRLIVDLRAYLAKSPVADRVEYFESSGMLKRKWMSEVPMLQSFALMHMVETTDATQNVRNLLRLLLTAAVQERVANIAFGPELYVKRAKLSQPKDVLGAFAEKVSQAADDLRNAPPTHATVEVHTVDSRNMNAVITPGTVSRVITSPPYPTEKDYTRNSRLELVFLGFVTDLGGLRSVKKEMIRSHSKGIYSTDDDGSLVDDVVSVQRIADELARRADGLTYGFAKLYPRIITEYFGGMRRHLRSLRPLMEDGGIAAYVVGEQTCYLQTYTPTATILGEIAELEEFEVKEILPFRVRTGSTGRGRLIREEVLVLRA